MAASRGERDLPPARRKTPVEFLTIPCLVYEAEAKQPVEGAVARIEIRLHGENSVWSMCKYCVAANREGRFVVRIPRKLLSGYREGFNPDVYVYIRHPHYSDASAMDNFDESQNSGPARGRRTGFMQLVNCRNWRKRAIEICRRTRSVFSKLLSIKPALCLYDCSDQTPSPCQTSRSRSRIRTGFQFFIDSPITDYEADSGSTSPARLLCLLNFDAWRNWTQSESRSRRMRRNWAMLFASEATKVKGLVLDADGKPIANIDVTTPEVGKEENGQTIYPTDETGHFEAGPLGLYSHYQAVVGEVNLPENEGKSVFGSASRLIHPGPIYGGKPDKPVKRSRAASEKSRVFTSRLVTTTVPGTAEKELPHVLDPLIFSKHFGGFPGNRPKTVLKRANR